MKKKDYRYSMILLGILCDRECKISDVFKKYVYCIRKSEYINKRIKSWLCKYWNRLSK